MVHRNMRAPLARRTGFPYETPMSGTIALIVAAGRSARAGPGAPKQYRLLGGKPVLRWSLERFHAAVGDRVVTVIASEDRDAYARAAAGLELLPPVEGGSTRQESVSRGLEALAGDAPEFVLIHDAARPLVSHAVIQRVRNALASGATAAIPVLPVADTLRRESPGGGYETVARDGVLRTQTPQGFRFEAILAAHRRFADEAATDDAALMERAGHAVAAIAGEETNIKLTTTEDFVLAERLAAGGPGDVRTGCGFDAHRFGPGDHVMLCGVRIAHDMGLRGHSDADAGLHALTDALLGAISAGDIGTHFPPHDARWRGADSALFLAHAARLVAETGGAIVHCDLTLICEQPKIAPHAAAMRARIAEILGVDPSRVSVKATTTEGMGFTGRGEGIAAQAVATVRVPA